MSISSPGIGSGLDVSAIVSQLVEIERQPIKLLQSKASEIQTQISSYGKLQSLIDTLGEKAAALSRDSLWKQTSSSSSDATVASATGSGTAAAGSYQINVTRLATAQSLASGAYASSKAVVGAGTLAIEIGSWNADSTAFAAKSGTTTLSLDFTDPATTLEQVRDRINQAGAGVSASIVTDANGARLTLRSSATGVENALRVTGTAGLSGLTYTPDAGGSTMTQTQAASNASFTVDGLAIESALNSVEGAIEGVTLKLAKVGSATITMDNDATSQKAAIDAFVTAYNDMNTYLAAQTKYDDATKKAGVLQGDGTAVGLRGQLRTVLREANGAAGAFDTLASIGFDILKDGSIKLDAKKVDAALARPAEVAKLLANVDRNVPGNNGLMVRLSKFADQVTGFDGLLTTRTEGLQTRLDRNGKDQDRLEDRVAQVQARLMRQYTALDTQVSQLNGLMSSVTAQMKALTASNNGSS